MTVVRRAAACGRGGVVAVQRLRRQGEHLGRVHAALRHRALAVAARAGEKRRLAAAGEDLRLGLLDELLDVRAAAQAHCPGDQRLDERRAVEIVVGRQSHAPRRVSTTRRPRAGPAMSNA